MATSLYPGPLVCSSLRALHPVPCTGLGAFGTAFCAEGCTAAALGERVQRTVVVAVKNRLVTT